MSRLIRAPKPPRSPFAPRLSVEANGLRLVQSKRDRKKTVIGIALRSAQHKAARWSGLAPKRVTPRNVSIVAKRGGLHRIETVRGSRRWLLPAEIEKLKNKSPIARLPPKQRKPAKRFARLIEITAAKNVEASIESMQVEAAINTGIPVEVVA